MGKIYKYASMDVGKKIMNNNCVVLNNPKNYNDPFDSVITLNEKDINKSIELISDFYMFKYLKEILPDKNLKINLFAKTFINFDMKLVNLYFKMYKRTRYYEGISKILTKYAMSVISSKLGAEYEKLRKEFVDIVMSAVNKARSEAYISCFSEENNSILMWSHYGDKHKGVCIEFDRPNEKFENVKYSKKRLRFDMIDTTKRILGYQIDNSKIDYTDTRLIKNIMTPFLLKSIDWKYEKEVRCLCSINDKDVTLRDEKIFYKMPTDITAIYIGCKAECSEADEIEKIANSRNIKVIYLKESETKYELT